MIVEVSIMMAVLELHLLDILRTLPWLYMSSSRTSALRGDERANLARVSEDYVRTVTHHSSINKCRRVLLRTIVARIGL